MKLPFKHKFQVFELNLHGNGEGRGTVMATGGEECCHCNGEGRGAVIAMDGKRICNRGDDCMLIKEVSRVTVPCTNFSF